MQEVYKAIGRVAAQNDTVLIRGESGTGKELIARAIYQHSPRKTGKFLAVNCAAIPETLLESELFGHERGAFTGAESRKVGKFEQCSGGTLFLDEIGDMTALSQSKVLRVLQEQKFERVGGKETIQTDVRIITATNRELEQMVADGQFRPIFTIGSTASRSICRPCAIAATTSRFSLGTISLATAASWASRSSTSRPRPTRSCGAIPGPAMCGSFRAYCGRRFCIRPVKCCLPTFCRPN